MMWNTVKEEIKFWKTHLHFKHVFVFGALYFGDAIPLFYRKRASLHIRPSLRMRHRFETSHCIFAVFAPRNFHLTKIKMSPRHPKVKLSFISTTVCASSVAPQEGISCTLLQSLLQCNPTYHPISSPASRPASITVWAQDKHEGQSEVTAFPLRSPGVPTGHFLLHNNSLFPLTMMLFTYCMHRTIIILKIYASKKAKTMSVSADAWWRWEATQ